MSIFKCKVCGGNMDVIDGVTVVEYKYCGTSETYAEEALVKRKTIIKDD